MYHSVPYEPLSQVTEKGAGEWVYTLDFALSVNARENPYKDEHGEFYNSNPYNPFSMTMKEPVAGTVKRGQMIMPKVAPDDFEGAAALLTNPLGDGEDVIKNGEALYDRFCEHCHGAKGAGDGLVAEKYLGVANLNGAAYLNLNEGHIFQVITYGKGLMGAHGSQLSEAERWAIAKYVKVLQAEQQQ